MWLKGGLIYDHVKGVFRAADIRIDGNRIAEIAKAPQSATGAIELDGAWLLPGFFDCHVHITLDTLAADPNDPWRDALPGTIALHAARMAGRLLDCGITTAREVGGWDYHEIAVREAINGRHIPGPRLSDPPPLPLFVTTGACMFSISSWRRSRASGFALR